MQTNEDRTTKIMGLFDRLWKTSRNKSHFYLKLSDVIFRKLDTYQDEIRKLRKENESLKRDIRDMKAQKTLF